MPHSPQAGISSERPAPFHSGTTVCWAPKGGSGTTVVAAALGLSLPRPTVLVDTAGDLPAVLGIAEPHGPGVHDWLMSDAPADQLHDLTVSVNTEPGGHVELIPAGIARHRGDTPRWELLLAALGSDGHNVVVDAGTGPPPATLHHAADRSLMVTRACYLALRRAVASPIRPTAVILVVEPGRALRAADVETAIGAPVIASVTVDPAVARAVDAGLLSARLPRTMQRDLRGAA
jgi:MinD-like ATPase involved in chromosome partitioning or flagellar assembly